MKKILFGLFAVLFVISLSAFHNFSSKKEKTTLQNYVWHKYNNAGTTELVPAVTFTGTDEEARTEFGCPEDNEVICARAYNDQGVPLDIYILKPAP